MAQKYASWAAKDTREAGSLPSDFDGAVVGAQFTKEPPDNYTAEGNPLFANISILRRDIEGTEEERTLVQSYSLGAKAGDEFSISSDGFGLIPTDDSIAAIRKGSKFDLWKCSLEGNGVPETITAAGDLSKLIGLDGHWRRVDDAKLLGKAREFANDKRQSKFPPQTLVLVKLNALPGEKAATKANGKATSAVAQQTTSATAALTGDIDADATTALLDVLKAQGKPVQRRVLVALLSKQAGADNPNRKVIATRGSDEGFLKDLAEAGLITFDPAADPQVVAAA